jgi:asparagine synthase (glutamine-hydrolysing)
MCGIAGLIHYSNPTETMAAVLSRIAHRGPDAEGIFISTDHAVALGHRRLSIIDLSAASNQPLIKDEWVLVFNGEIYNYQALKNELITKGATFNTHSDTEVLLEAWRHWGPACLNRLRGMFVFALYNTQTKQLFLARDAYGIKPLFLYEDNGRIAFASELKAIRPLIAHENINHTALAASLLYVWIPDSQCMIENVRKFPAGHFAEIIHNHIAFYPFDDFSETIYQPMRRISVDEFESTLLDSVEKHLIADVPVSTFLSGGLDSSLLTAMAKSKTDKLDAYTIAFQKSDQLFEAMPDDALYAEKIAKQLGVSLHRVEITSDIVSLLPKMVASLDEPIGDAAAINTFLICQAARDAGVKVLLSGMGADELFAGYRKHYACALAQKYQKIPRFLRNKIISPMIDALPVAGKNRGYRVTRWLKRFSDFANLPEEQAFLRSYTYYSRDALTHLLSPDLQNCISPIFEEHTRIYHQADHLDFTNRLCYTDMNLFLKGLNVTYTDRASMAASTEVRVPFIDREVVKLAFQMPGSQKLHGRTGKYLLKKVAERWLPHDIIYRPKAGFGAPLRSWIRHDLRDQIDDMVLSERGLLGRGLLNRTVVRDMVQADRAGKMDYSQQIWQFLTLEYWLRG